MGIFDLFRAKKKDEQFKYASHHDFSDPNLAKSFNELMAKQFEGKATSSEREESTVISHVMSTPSLRSVMDKYGADEKTLTEIRTLLLQNGAGIDTPSAVFKNKSSLEYMLQQLKAETGEDIMNKWLRLSEEMGRKYGT